MSKFGSTSNDLTEHRRFRAEVVKQAVADGVMAPLSGEEFDQVVNVRPKKPLNPLKVARLLCPNAF